MFRYKLADVMDEKNLTKIIERFTENELPRFRNLEKYYKVKNTILEKTVTDGKPNNKLAHGFAKYITKMATGYFMGKGVRYQVNGEDASDNEIEEYKKLLFNILDNNYTTSGNFEISKEASKKGISYEILYVDEKSRLKTKKLNAEEIIPIYSPDLGEFLECAIRIWSSCSISSSEVTEHAALYTDEEILLYSKKANESAYSLDEIQSHLLDDIPVIVYWNNEEQVGDYEDIITLIDAYDKAQSDTANDSDYFADAYFYVTGALGGQSDRNSDEDEAAKYHTMRRERILELDENGQAGWITKNVNDAAQENYKDRLYKDIFFISQVPALSDESFAGNLAGVAIRYKLIGLEELTMEKEHKFRSAQKKKLRIITDYINMLHNKSFNADNVAIKMERNLIDNTSEIIEDIAKLEGITSKETQLGMLPFIPDASKEIEKIRNEENGDTTKDDIYNDFRKNITKKKEDSSHGIS